MQQTEKLARLFFDAYQEVTPGFAMQGNIPIRKWEELPVNTQKTLIAVCVEVLQKWHPGQPSAG